MRGPTDTFASSADIMWSILSSPSGGIWDSTSVENGFGAYLLKICIKNYTVKQYFVQNIWKSPEGLKLFFVNILMKTRMVDFLT